MKRLTTNKNVNEMGMFELAHNCCYIKEGLARYRDFEMDMDARDFARNLMTTLVNEDMPLDDELFDEEIMENLIYDQFSDVKGLIAIFYRNLWAMADLRETLKRYEDAKEQGLLKKLPLAIGSDVYFIPSKVNYDLNVLSKHEENNRVYHQKVANIVFNKRGWYLECDKNLEHGVDHILVDVFYKETWFTSEEEAEQALKQMGE